MPGRDPIHILIVEDSPTDRLIAVQALKLASLSTTLHFAEDGEQAMSCLRAGVEDPSGVRPHLILLDLNLPKKDGRAVLSELKADPELQRIPVVVLTTSSATEDITRAYALHANSYITKPVDFAEFARRMSSLIQYWFEVVTLPTR
jgi:two-component system cell cycle sensor histidine kinase/response regulator CckA